MNGLEKILLKIEEDNRLKINEILSESKAASDERTSAIIAEATAESDAIISDARKKASAIRENAVSGCASYMRKQELSAKSEVISLCICKILESLENSETEKYFGIIQKLIEKYAHPCDGELILSRRDIERMPSGFMENTNALLKKNGASLSLCTESAKISGGFILRYGEIEENCTFSALIDEKKDMIKDALSAGLSS